MYVYVKNFSEALQNEHIDQDEQTNSMIYYTVFTTSLSRDT